MKTSTDTTSTARENLITRVAKTFSTYGADTKTWSKVRSGVDLALKDNYSAYPDITKREALIRDIIAYGYVRYAEESAENGVEHGQ